LNFERHVQGEFQGPGEEVYKGSWVKDYAHGEGSHTLSDGKMLVGKFNRWRLTNGMIHYPNGDHYNGEVMNASPHGRGFMQYATGSWYSGDWVNGFKHGYGDYFIRTKGEIHTGIRFANNRPYHTKN